MRKQAQAVYSFQKLGQLDWSIPTESEVAIEQKEKSKKKEGGAA